MTTARITISMESWYEAHSRCPQCATKVDLALEMFLPPVPFVDSVTQASCPNQACVWRGPVASCIAPALAPQIRQARRRMIPILQAASTCLSMMSKLGMTKALEAIDRLTGEDIQHAIVWLGSMEACATGGIEPQNVDKLVAVCESILRVRPKVIARLDEAKAAKAKAQAEN